MSTRLAFRLALTATVVFAGCALHEWVYLKTHVHHGPAGTLVAMALAGALLASAVTAHLYRQLTADEEVASQLVAKYARKPGDDAGDRD